MKNKTDKKQLKEVNNPGSRTQKLKDIKNAQDVLEFIKNNLTCIGNTFLQQGESCFSRKEKVNKKPEISLEGKYSIPEAAEYLKLKEGTFAARTRTFKLPFEKVGKMKYFTQETLDHHKATTVFKPRNEKY